MVAFQEAVALFGDHRETWRSEDIVRLKDSGASLLRIFSEVQGEMTRADNVFCGINAEADHSALIAFFKNDKAATTLTDEKRTLLVKQLILLTDSRRIVKDLLTVDQLSDDTQFNGTNVAKSDSHQIFINSSLGDIEDRNINAIFLSHFESLLDKLLSEIPNWRRQQEELASLSLPLSDLLKNQHLSEDDIVDMVKNGWRGQFGFDCQESLQSLDTVITEARKVIFGDKSSDKDRGQAIEILMREITKAQATLEGQVYYFGLCLLSSETGVLMASLREEAPKP